MKKSTLLTAAVLLLVSASTAAPHALSASGKAARSAIANGLPRNHQVYIYNPDKQWDAYESITYEYDAAGNTIKMESLENKNRMLYTYNSNNKRTSSEEYTLEQDGTWYPKEKKAYAYDPIVTDLIIDQRFFEWDGLENAFTAQTYVHTVEVERDDRNRVNSWVRYTVNPTTDELDSTTVVKITYDPQTGNAVTWSMSERDRDDNYIMKEGIRYENIEWQNTDHQITGESNDFLVGNNRMKKAVAYMDGVRFSYNVTFDESGTTPDFRAEIKADNGSRSTIHILETTDANGSTSESFDELYTVTNEETGKEEKIVSYRRLETTYDNHGNMILQEEYMVDENGQEYLGTGAKYTYTYDEQGRMTESIQEDYNFDDKQWYYGLRHVYSDFYTPSAVRNPQAAPALTAFVSGDRLVIGGCDNPTGYTLYGLNGAALQSGSLTAGEAIDLASLGRGLYIAAISTADGTTGHVKFVK